MYAIANLLRVKNEATVLRARRIDQTEPA